MERAIQIFAIINFAVIGISHVVRPRVWVDFFVYLRERGEAGGLHPLAAALSYHVWFG